MCVFINVKKTIFVVLLLAGTYCTASAQICTYSTKVVPEKDPEMGGAIQTWIVDSHARLLTCPGSNRETGIDFRFGDRFFLANGKEIILDGKSWRLLLQNIGSISTGNMFEAVGWVDREKLLVNYHPLMNDNSLRYKALINNQRKAGGEQRIPVYSSPAMKGQPAHFLHIDSLLYVYKVYPNVF